jgi:hypothetical protein
MFSVCVCVCVFLCLCTGRGLATSWSPVQGVLPTVHDQETEETQPYAPKREQAPKCGSKEEETMFMYAYGPISPHNDSHWKCTYLTFSPINDNLIFHGIIVNLLLLYRLPYFLFCLLVFLCLLRTRANFVIGLWAVSLHVHIHELNYYYYYFVCLLLDNNVFFSSSASP